MISKEQISFIRKFLKLSQADFGSLMGVRIATVQKWEYGDFKPGRLRGEALNKLYNLIKNNGSNEIIARLRGIALTYTGLEAFYHLLEILYKN